MVRQLGHVALQVKDLDRALRFYCDGLGLAEAFRLNHDDGSPWIVYLTVGNGTFIELFPVSPAKELGARDVAAPREVAPPAKPVTPVVSGLLHVCLLVDDIQDAQARLRLAGIEPDGPPTVGKDHNWQLWVTDPDGNRIELMQISPGSPQARSS
jgi:lactoylglutathione lyase